ncbi:SDR family NAD(P)-dependent oxidoreductase [Eubacteriales bacterium DFI.9.88]|nr:SDR family NAD(P)-dependent oxidoreductase [Eubacteriales bacterium DFI.9.88]
MKARMLDGKVAIITGASYGMGCAMAELFAKEGAKLVITARGKEQLDAEVEKIKKMGHEDVIGVVADNQYTEDIKRVIKTAVDAYGDLDIVLNNAGIGEQKSIEETEDEWMEFILKVNLEGPMKWIRESLKIFRPKNDGVIINVSSVNGERPMCGAAYTSSKGGLNTLTKNVAMLLNDTNIRVNALAPGATRTPAHLANLEGKQEGGKSWEGHNDKYMYFPGPECECIDQAWACLYLASEMGRCVKGQVLQVCNAAFL